MDKTVIIILIGCATLIALAAIGCDFWVEKKTAETPERLWPNKTIKIHRNYIAGFLGFGIIMLLTAQYGGTCEDLLKYLSFGSTLTSLVLSVLAIFVTVRSSFDLYKQYGTIKQVSEQIGESLRNLKTSETKIGEVSSDISTQMERIVEEIEKRLDVRLKKTESAISEQLQRQNVDTQGSNSLATNSELDYKSFIGQVPYNGLLALYACAKGFEKNKEIQLVEIFEENKSYCLGVIMTTFAAGYIQGSVKESGDIVICNYASFKTSDVIDVFKRFKEPYLSMWKDDIKPIDEFFDK